VGREGMKRKEELKRKYEKESLIRGEKHQTTAQEKLRR